MKSLGFLFTLVGGVLLQGCANSDLPRPADLPTLGDMPFVHKIDIQQGNVITQDMVAQLEYGMDKKKVNFIMGSPVIQDTFHADRWDYLYTISRDGGKTRRRRVTLFFADDLLVRVEGDVKPAAGRLDVDMRQDMTVDVPKAEPAGLVMKLANTIPFVGEEEVRKKPESKDAGRVVADEDALPTELKQPAKPALTPVQRAALEEQGGPGVLAKIKEAMPFTGEGAEASAAAAETTAAEDEEPAESVADGEASPGLLAKLKGAMPFTGDEEAADASSADGAEPAGEAGADETTGGDSGDTDGAASARGDADDDEYADDEEDYAHDEASNREDDDEDDDVAVAPPPVAPTAFPLENQLTREAANAAPGPAPEEGVEVPAEKPQKKRGFFARLFGRDRPEDAADADSEQRQYRDITDPDAN